MPETFDQLDSHKILQANRPILLSKKPKLSFEKIERNLCEEESAVTELMQSGNAIVHSNRSFNTSSSNSNNIQDTLGCPPLENYHATRPVSDLERCKQKQTIESNFCDLVTIYQKDRFPIITETQSFLQQMPPLLSMDPFNSNPMIKSERSPNSIAHKKGQQSFGVVKTNKPIVKKEKKPKQNHYQNF